MATMYPYKNLVFITFMNTLWMSQPAQHALNVLLFVRCLEGWTLTMSNREGWDAMPLCVAFRLVNNYVAHCYLLLGNKIWPKLSKNCSKKPLISLRIANSCSQILHDQKALTLSFMPKCEFTWECVGIESCALHSIEKWI